MALQLWETSKEAITAYTGLSPATFFTVLALAFAVYYVISGFFGSSDHPRSSRDFEQMEPLPPPVQLGEITEEDLKVYDGSDPKNPLLMAIKGQIYDVSQSRMFYGPGGPYALFAGKDASRALAKMSFEDKDLTGILQVLVPLNSMPCRIGNYKFMSKLPNVMLLKPAEDGPSERVQRQKVLKPLLVAMVRRSSPFLLPSTAYIVKLGFVNDISIPSGNLALHAPLRRNARSALAK
ncbi:hypothetical protein HHK36_032994 [Tetracentron sinense]|uniref:Cytochrome b5 heme-binding domain-containing protein n=1 Tax=Tetracentron sinense TaxID=13715 RepID=A0A834Y8B3_TETSI|nr:hypothetical protein HHK36_032994 [Tetracentron sinense]